MAEPVHLYALVDLAAAPELLPLIEGLARTGAARCLFEGRLDPALLRVSPYIVDTARAPGLLERWRTEGAGKPWGVLMESALPMHLARRHVRRFLQVRLPDGSGPVLCRFWDPRVLGVLLETADAEWLSALFRGVEAYVFEAESRLGPRRFARPAGPTLETRPAASLWGVAAC